MFAQILKANGFTLRYLNKKSIGELDFIVQRGNKVVPIEIKSGKDYKKHAALDKALKVKEWALEQGIVFCSGNIEAIGQILYLPWYMAMFFKQQDLNGLKVTVDVNF